jgi:3-oxoacyl-[acyl-carrier protein] reductase
MLLEDRVAIITGGARGIGSACAERFLAEGARGVVLADIDEARGREAAARFDRAGNRVAFVRTDVTRRADVDACVAAAVARFGKLEIVVNNAGIAGDQGPLEAMSEASLDRIFAVNVKGPWFFCAAAKPILSRAGYGRIINIASIAGKEGNPALAAYSMTKAALIGLTKAFAKEVVRDGILVHAVAPAVIETEILEQVTPEVREYMIQKIPMGRTGRPEEVAHLVAFLASDRSTFTTGFCHDISGGRATY